MRIEWTTLILAAFTDLVITMGTALGTAMMANGSAELPSKAVILVAFLGGAVSAAQTIRQALKATPESVRLLRGE